MGAGEGPLPVFFERVRMSMDDLGQGLASNSPSPAADIYVAPKSPLLTDAMERFRSGDLAGAVALCRQILASADGAVEALTLLGAIATVDGETTEAIPLLRVACTLAPQDIAPLNALGLAYMKVGKFAEARACFEAIIKRDSDSTEGLRNLAHCLHEAKEWEKSLIIFKRLFAKGEIRPKDLLTYASSLFNLKRNGQAIGVLKRYLAYVPSAAEAWFSLAQVLYGIREATKAVAAFRRCIHCDSNKLMAYTNISAIAQRHSNAGLAARVSRECLAIKPDYLPILMNYGLALGSLGKVEEAIEAFGTLVAKAPQAHTARSNHIFFSHYRDDISSREMFDLYREWNRVHAAPVTPTKPVFTNARDAGKRLRIGYVSPDFCVHSCMLFLTSLYENHDRRQVEVFSYSNVDRSDGITDWVRERSDGWRDINGKNEGEVAEQIRADGIDILIDLAGHTGRNSLLVFARRPAPVQATWLGYPGTTGLEAIEYRISDPWLTPPDTPELFSEAVYNLPRISHCFSPPPAPDIASLPARQSGYVTFGSFNHFTKISRSTVALWAGVLRRVEGSRLVLKSRYINSPEVREHLYSRFEAAGADTRRITVLNGHAHRDDHLSAYNQLDIALDTTPYGGMTTTCEALWMGVPVMTLAGQRTCSRYGAAVLPAVGLDDLVADSPEAFADIAARLASDLDRLEALRTGMRDRLLASPLCDAGGFTRVMEAAYRDMWTRWCHSA